MALHVTNKKLSYKIRVLNWPVNSLNLNPIKNLWVVLKNQSSERQLSISSLKHLENIKIVRTHDITSEYCCKVIESMSRRLKKVIENKGKNSKY